LTSKLPTFKGRNVSLTEVIEPMIDELHSLATSPGTGFRWRFQGRTPSRAEFSQMLWNGVSTQFVVIDNQSRTLLGLVQLYNPDTAARHAYVSALGRPPRAGDLGVFLEGLILVVEFAFNMFDNRKIYAEIPAFNVEQFGPMARYFTKEAQLGDHVFHMGSYVPLEIWSVTRADWSEKAGRVVRWVGNESL
jgi:RimJ/RimL family protein N-acetyltransferase